MSDWQTTVRKHPFPLSPQPVPFVGVLPEFEVVKRLEKIKKEQVEVVFSGIKKPAAFTDNV